MMNSLCKVVKELDDRKDDVYHKGLLAYFSPFFGDFGSPTFSIPSMGFSFGSIMLFACPVAGMACHDILYIL